MTDANDGDDGAVVAVAGAVVHLPSLLALINHSFPVGVAAVVNYCSLVRLLFCKSARRIVSKSIKMDSGPERRGQLKTQHGSPVLSVHLRNCEVDCIAYVWVGPSDPHCRPGTLPSLS